MPITSDEVWLVNKSPIVFERTDLDLKKHIILKPNRPIRMPRRTAMKYMRFKGLAIIENPEIYWGGSNLKRLIIRDAGIGDLLLLEPVLRQMYKDGKTDVSILSRFPEVYQYNPIIQNNLVMSNKADIPNDVDVTKWDCYDDIRSYSETCINREIKHRTDCYNQVFNVNIEDKEPRLYFSNNERGVITKKEGYRYIGLACDGSHFFRRYAKGVELIDYILKADEKNIIVVIGDGWEDDKGFLKINREDERILDYQGKTTIRDSMLLIRDMDYMISVDTGLMHIALSLHIPTVCIFSIITPELRVQYYTGQKQIVAHNELGCIGCGNFHMAHCQHGEKMPKHDFIPPCLRIDTKEIYDKMMEMSPEVNKRIYYNTMIVEKKGIERVNIVNGKTKIMMPIIVLNEEANLPRFIDLVMSHPAIGKTIAIDGGSDDKTVEILRKAGALVYENYYDKHYHDAQALQRNISCSFVPDGEKIIIMDIDECFSSDLYEYLYEFAESNIEFGELSRRTYSYYKDINNPMMQIKHYPDYQPRLFTWDRRFKWVGSPHHQIYNAPPSVKINKDIIHFESEGKDRVALELQWAEMNRKTKEVYR